jgi:hypothetical protein
MPSYVQSRLRVVLLVVVGLALALFGCLHLVAASLERLGFGG